MSNWEQEWSTDKKSWCCGRTGTACDPFDCLADAAQRETLWSIPKKEYCCDQKHVGCPSVAKALFDCDERLADWRTSWSSDERSWCCKIEGKGCDEYDCELSLTWLDLDAPGRLEWCCQQHTKRCASAPHDSGSATDDDTTVHTDEEVDSPAAAASDDTTETGAETTPFPELTLFDCEEELSCWQTCWAQERKNFCCSLHGRGCDHVELESTGRGATTTTGYPTFPEFSMQVGSEVPRLSLAAVVGKEVAAALRNEGTAARSGQLVATRGLGAMAVVGLVAGLVLAAVVPRAGRRRLGASEGFQPCLDGSVSLLE